MKRIFLILTLLILCMPVFAQNAGVIKDELLDPKMYADGNNSVFKLGISKKGEYQYIPIKDELIDDDFVANLPNFTTTIKKEYPDDFFFEKHIDPSKVRKISPKNRYDFTKKQVPVQIKLSQQIKTKGLLEGSVIPFVTTHDFEINDKIFKKGTTVLGRVETLSASDKMGVPETLKIDNFYIQDDGQEINLSGSISKTGANRSIWVYPLYQAGNITFYVAGFVFVPIHGGRAKLSPTESFTLFYEAIN